MVNKLIDKLKDKFECDTNSSQSLFILFTVYRKLYEYFSGDYQKKYFVSELSSQNIAWIEALKQDVETHYPLVPYTVFEDGDKIKEITADVWKESLLSENGSDAGIITMTFQADCRKLPLHVHPLSERILIILDGNGFGHYALEQPKDVSLSEISSVIVKRGSVIFFNRNTVHTFSTGPSSLTTLTYHLPFIEFDDEESFEKFASWYPKNLLNSGQSD